MDATTNTQSRIETSSDNEIAKLKNQIRCLKNGNRRIMKASQKYVTVSNRHIENLRNMVSEQTKLCNSLRHKLESRAGQSLSTLQPSQTSDPFVELVKRLKGALTLKASAFAPPEAFYLFPELPDEIQDLIWIFARPEGRYIALRVTCSTTEGPYISSPARVPALLHTCIRSRTVARKWYRLSFGGFIPRVYFDAARDGIYVACGTLESFDGYCGHDKVMRNMQWMTLGVQRVVWESPSLHNPALRIAVSFPDLRELTLVQGDGKILVKEIGASEFRNVFEMLEDGDEVRLKWQQNGKTLMDDWRDSLVEKWKLGSNGQPDAVWEDVLWGKSLERIGRARFRGLPPPDLESMAWGFLFH